MIYSKLDSGVVNYMPTRRNFDKNSGNKHTTTNIRKKKPGSIVQINFAFAEKKNRHFSPIGFLGEKVEK